MRRRHALHLAFAALLGALAIVALPALAGADDHGHHRGHEPFEHRHHHGDHHGLQDGAGDAGTISAFDATSGKLTIALFGGESITGVVTSRTEIECEGADDRAASASRDGGNSGSGSGGDSGGRGEEEPGDDHGEGVEPGDDNGRGGENGEGATCSTADLTVGAVVHEADLEARGGVASFDDVELAQAS